LKDFNYNVINSCSFLTFGKNVTNILSRFVCPPRFNSWHSLHCTNEFNEKKQVYTTHNCYSKTMLLSFKFAHSSDMQKNIIRLEKSYYYLLLLM